MPSKFTAFALEQSFFYLSILNLLFNVFDKWLDDSRIQMYLLSFFYLSFVVFFKEKSLF